MTFSQAVWAIDELVRLICSHTLEYRVNEWNEDYVHNGLVLDKNSRQTLARGVLYLNRSISRIAVKFLWKELSGLDPLCALFPLDYFQHDGMEYVSGLYRCTHWTTIKPLGTIEIREGRNERGL